MRAASTPAPISELERVIEVMRPYINKCNLLDVVYSGKFGYILLSLPPKDKLGDAEVIPLDKPETLLDRLYTELAYDFMELEGHCGDYTEATPLEKRALRNWMKKYTDQLPEYNGILDNLLSE